MHKWRGHLTEYDLDMHGTNCKNAQLQMHAHLLALCGWYPEHL